MRKEAEEKEEEDEEEEKEVEEPVFKVCCRILIIINYTKSE